MKAPLIVISGASGSGKTTICRLLAQRLGFYYGVSHTTRPMRKNETHSVDYFFVSRDEFDRMVKHGDFLEHAVVYNNYYGTSKSVVDEHRLKGRGVVLDVDTQGALNIKKAVPEACLIFLKSPSVEVLRKRLEKRGTDSPENIEKRLKEALKEESFSSKYDYVVVNEDLDRAYDEVEVIVKKVP